MMPADQSLNDLVTVAASHLMGVTATTLDDAAEKLLRELVGYFDVDLSFFRRNDHTAGTTNLVAEWPPRPHVPDPDPLGVVPFAGADRTFAATEHLSAVMITHPDGADEDYQDTVRKGSGLAGHVSSVTPPCARSPPCSPRSKHGSPPRSGSAPWPTTTSSPG
jgi:hypothetical protein